VDVKESSTRWIIIGSAAALWASTALAAWMELALHWYLAIWLAAGVASLGVVALLMDASARARETERRAAGRAACDDMLKVLCAAIGDNARRAEVAADKHAGRVEAAATRHVERLRREVFTFDRLTANLARGEALAAHDAALEAEARNAGNDTGPMPVVSRW